MPKLVLSQLEYMSKRDQIPYIFFFLRSHLNIAGIENYSNLQDILPLSWSTPSLGNAIRHDLEPPLVQQAAFDDTVRRKACFSPTSISSLNSCIAFTFRYSVWI